MTREELDEKLRALVVEQGQDPHISDALLRAAVADAEKLLGKIAED